jgi:DHA1 family bicyclomycin/chloramphenicol resistance-like MFS transporter
MVLSRAVIRDLASGRAAASAFSLMMLIMGVAPILAPVLGAQVLRLAGWRWIFGAMSLAGAAAWLIAWLTLPESLPVARRSRGGVLAAFADYARLLRNREYVGYLLVLAAHGGALFTFITCSPVVFQRNFGGSPGEFSALFAVVSAGMVGATALNYALLKKFAPGKLLQVSLVLMVLAATALLAWTWLAQSGGVAGGGRASVGIFVALLFATMSLGGMISPNATTLALAPCGQMAGAASALIGTVVFAAGGIGGTLASNLPAYANISEPTAMCAMLFLCAAIGLLAFKLAGSGKMSVPFDALENRD